MIPAPHAPYEARYRHENDGHPYFTTKPVVAWDNDGAALVPDEKAGRLRDADSYSNFAGLVAVGAQVVGVIPAGDWRTEYRTETGDVESRPLLAWLVHSDGTITPATADSDGYTDDPTTDSNFIRLYDRLED